MVVFFSLNLLSSCSLFEREQCSENSDCFASFGAGSICNIENTDEGAGFCTLCTDNIDCVDSYGNGSVCTTTEKARGSFPLADIDIEPKYCEQNLLQPNPRCAISFPADIWNDWESYSDAIIIGQMFRGDTDLSKITATQLALEQVQEAQGEKERPFVSVLCDYSPSTGTNDPYEDGLNEADAIKLISDHLVDDFGAKVIIGPPSSGASDTALGHLDGRAVLISPSATSEALSDDDPSKMFWRTVTSDHYQSEALVNLIGQKEEEARSSNSEHEIKVGVIYTDQTYGAGIADAIREKLTVGTVTEFKFSEDTNPDAVEIVLQGAEGSEFESVTSIVFAISNKDLLRQAFMNVLDYNANQEDSRLYFFTDSAARSEVFDADIRQSIKENPSISGSNGQIWGTRPAILEDGPFSNFNADFEIRFTEANGLTYEPTALYKYSAENNVFAAYSYDAMWLGILGSLWAQYSQNETPLGVAEGLEKLYPQNAEEGQDITPLRATEWRGFVSAAEAQESIDIQGTSGELNFNPLSGQVEPRIERWYIDENSTQQIFDECFWDDLADPPLTCE